MTDTTQPFIEPSEDVLSFRQVTKILVGLLLALFTAFLSSTIVANALPQIIADLHGSQSQYAWVITVTLLANAASTPIWGKLSDLFNKKLLVQTAIILFTIGSVTAGFAPNVEWLLVSRAVQGLGMGGLLALSQAVIATITPPSERGRYSGIIGAIVAVAQTSGPLAGGFIVDSPLGWRWTFFVCVPFAIASLILLHLTLRVPTIRTGPVHIDWLGAVLLTSGVSVLLIWVSFAGPSGWFAWMSWPSAAMGLGGLALLVITVLVERRVADPIVPLRILRQRTPALAVLASLPVGVAMFSTSTFLGEYFQISRGESPTVSGLLQLPMVFGTMIASAGTGVMITRNGRWKQWLVLGALLLTGSLYSLSFTDHQTALALTCARIAVFGLGCGMLMQNLVLAVQNTVSVREVGSASSAVVFFRTFAGASGVAVLGTVLANRVSELTATGFAALGVETPATSGESGGGLSLDMNGLPDTVRDVVMSAYGDGTGRIFLISSVLSLVTLVCVLLIPQQRLRTTLDLADAPADPDNAAPFSARRD